MIEIHIIRLRYTTDDRQTRPAFSEQSLKIIN